MTKKLRPLATKDVFKVSRIIKALKLNVMDLNISDTTSTTQAGIEFFKMVLENLHLAEDELSSFVAELAGMTTDEFNDLPLEEGLALIAELKEQKGIIDFLKSAAKLTK